MFCVSVNAGASGIKIHPNLLAFGCEFYEMAQLIPKNTVLLFIISCKIVATIHEAI